MAILNPSNVVLQGKTREKGVFASNGKEYPFLLVGVFPKPPARQKYAGRTPCGAWWLARPEGRFSAGGIAKAGGRVKGK